MSFCSVFVNFGFFCKQRTASSWKGVWLLCFLLKCSGWPLLPIRDTCTPRKILHLLDPTRRIKIFLYSKFLFYFILSCPSSSFYDFFVPLYNLTLFYLFKFPWAIFFFFVNNTHIIFFFTISQGKIPNIYMALKYPTGLFDNYTNSASQKGIAQVLECILNILKIILQNFCINKIEKNDSKCLFL